VNKQAPTIGRLATMIVFVLSCFGLLTFLWLTFGGAVPLGPKGYRVSVDFKEATQLAEQADVRISGVPVGKVVKIGETPEGGIRAEIEMEERFAPLHRDARATLRQKTLLGETFVELTPGTRGSATVPEGGRLPSGQVRPTVELDEVLRSFDTATRRDLQTLLAGLSSGVSSRGQALNDAVGSVAPAVESGGDVLAVLDAQRGAVSRLIRDSGQAFGALGRRRAETRALVRAGAAVLRTTARREEDLASTVRILPTFLGELRATLAVAQDTAVDAEPVVRALRPVAPLVPPILRDTNAVLPGLRGLLRDVDPAVAAARGGLPAAVRTIDAARELTPTLHRVARDLRPVVAYLGLYRTELMTAFANIAAATQATYRQPGPRRRCTTCACSSR
jgi:virulence factor Mce-like protein